MTRNHGFASILVMLIALAAGNSAVATAKVQTFTSVKADGGVVVFNLEDVRPATIRRASVRVGHVSRRLALRAVQRGARRGVLRVQVSRRLARTATTSGRRKPKLVVVTDPVPAPSPTTDKAVVWRSVGAAPLSDGEAASRVRPVAENRPGNADENAYRPSVAELDSFRNGQVDRYGRTQVQYNPLAAHVTGGFSGSTDEILQWAAHKWGIPEDVVRAAATNESNWRMSQLGDRKTVSDPSRYPAQSRIAGTSDVYESLGIMQVRWTPEGLHQGTESLRWKSTAFNVDYWASVVRYYYDGLCSWCGAGYSAGQEWASVGAWYNPSPWISASAAYVERAKTHLANPPWTQPGF